MIQIFGTNRSFDCKAAQRFFKERRVPFQFVDLKEKEIRPVKARYAQGLDSSVCQISKDYKSGMSRGEFDSVVGAIAKSAGSRAAAIDAMTDKKSKDYAQIAYLDDGEKEQKLFENQAKLLALPICRNGKTDATVGMQQKVWEGWK